MKPTQVIANAASTPRVGLFAMLRAFLHVEGSGAPGAGRGIDVSRAVVRLILSGLIVTLGSLAVASAPALAAAPEAPEVSVQQPVKASEATFLGVLEPKVSEISEPEMGTYGFLYRASKAEECKGGLETTPGMSFGGARETLPAEPVTGLAAGTEYAVCLQVETPGGKAISTPVTFVTATPPEAPEGTSVKEFTSSTAKIEATVNPKKEAVTGYYVLYGDSGKCTAGGSSEPVAPALVKSPTKAIVDLSGLEPSRKYEACMVADNAAGETAMGGEAPFTTPASRPTVESQASSAVTGGSAHLEASVNPNNQTTECKFRYGTDPSLATGTDALCEPATFPAEYGLQAVALNLSGLESHKTYYFRILASNGSGVQEGSIAHFETAIPPETPEVIADVTGPRTATLHGTLNPANTGEAGSYQFLYEASESECAGGTSTPEPAGEAHGAKAEALSASLTGLKPGATYSVCLKTTNSVKESSQSGPITFSTPPAAPAVGGEYPTSIARTGVTLDAMVEPDGATTTFEFEYGPTEGYGTTTKPTELPADGIAEAQIPEAGQPALAPGTTYHYRVIATNVVSGETETAIGHDATFTTQAEPGSELPQHCGNEKLREEQPFGLTLSDCRAYELVSPANTDGQDATREYPESFPRASEAKELEPAIAYSTRGSFGAVKGALEESEYVSRRTPSGWSTQDVTPPSTPSQGREEFDSAYQETFVTPELTAGVTISSAKLTEEAPQPQAKGEVGAYVASFDTSAYQWLGQVDLRIPPWGASADLSRVVLPGGFGENNLIEWDDGTRVPVSVTNTREIISGAVGERTAESLEYVKDAWHAISEDGSRVYFMTPAEPSEGIGDLYVRVNIGERQSALGGKGECLEAAMACTIDVSASEREPDDPAGPRSPRYWGASSDGSKVFFTSDSELTQNAYTGVDDKAANLYEYDLETGVLRDLTVDDEDVAEGAAVQGVVQISEDGSYVYFVADGKLATRALQGEPNLYVSHDGGTPVLIATLSPSDRTDWGGQEPGEALAGPGTSTAVVSPGGGQLAFISERALTAYDNEQAQAGECEAGVGEKGVNASERESGMCREVYLYDVEMGALVCASCNPSGARPVGGATLGSGGAAAGGYRPRGLLADGTLFFDSRDGLVQGAASGQQSVYEYDAGAIHAISNPAGGNASFFLDASPDGKNVFFASADRLSPEDPGGNIVVWDARVEGGFPVASPPVPCASGESCQAPAIPAPVVGAPASATFSGTGNLAPQVLAPVKEAPKPIETRAQKLAKALSSCRRDRSKRKRARCETAARAAYGPKRAKNASNGREAGR